MDVILHIGAHRTATTSFQHYLRRNSDALQRDGVATWEPRRTRNGLLTGVMPTAGHRAPADQLRRAAGRIAMNLRGAELSGLTHVVVSDENIMGTPRRNLRTGQLYGDVGARMARFRAAFGARLNRVVLSVRPQHEYWTSVMGFWLGRGYGLPDARTVARIARARRGWQDVIRDVAEALPEVELRVMDHAGFAEAPDHRLGWMTDRWPLPPTEPGMRRNPTPDLTDLKRELDENGVAPGDLSGGSVGWPPFDRDQTHALREAWEDDLFWLRAGADGLATWIEETGPETVGQNPRPGQTTRGQGHGIEERRLG